MAFTPVQQNWKWFRDDNAEPSASLSAENTPASLLDATSTVRLRVTVNNSGSTAGNNRTLSLEYSTDDTTFTAFGAGAHWNYANGQATNAGTTTTFKTTDGTTHGLYHEDGTTLETWTASQVRELDIAIAPTANVTVGKKYFFRLLQSGTVIPLASGGGLKTHPAVFVPVPVPVGTLSVGGKVASLALAVGIGIGSLGLTGLTAQAVLGGSPIVSIPVGTLALTSPYVGVAFAGPLAGSLDLTGAAPVGFVGTLGVPIPVGALTLTGQIPAFALPVVPAGSLSLTGQLPVLASVMPVPVGSLGLTGYAAMASPLGIIPIPVGTLTLSAPYLGIAFSGPPAGSLALSGQIMTRTAGAPSVAIPVGSLGFASPYIGVAFLAPTVGSLTLTGQSAGGNVVSVPVGALALTGNYVGIRFGEWAEGTLALTGYQPTPVIGFPGGAQTIAVPVGTLTLSSSASVLRAVFSAPVGVLGLTGATPKAALVHMAQVGALALTGLLAQPVFLQATRALPAGSLDLTGQMPTVSFMGSNFNPAWAMYSNRTIGFTIEPT